MPREGQYWRHFKGNLYYVIAVAKHTETDEEMVIYRDTNYDEKVWCRPVSMWDDLVVDKFGNPTCRFVYHSDK